jgi:hypothetical protein
VSGAERVSGPRAGGTYLEAPWRFVIHTIEGEPSAADFRRLAATHTNPPHLWAMPSANLLLQTIPLDRSAYALARPGSIQTNRLRAVQVELWGFAAKMGTVAPDVIAWLAERVLAPVVRLVPIDLTSVRPAGPREPCYGTTSPCRMTAEQWQAFNGVCGHKDVPDNKHWDPGQLNLAAIAERARTVLGPTSYLRRERVADHDGPYFEFEREESGDDPRMAEAGTHGWIHPQQLAPAAPPAVLTLGQKVPDKSEVDVVGAIAGKILRGSAEFNSLVKNTNPDIVFKNEEGTDADRMMTLRLQGKLDAVATSVKSEWPGKMLRVTEAWDENNEHASGSSHYEGRAADITVTDLDVGKLGRLAKLAVDAGFDWVFYENAVHVHVSVKK